MSEITEPTPEATQNMMKKLFRRSSLTPAKEYGVIKSSAMLTILDSMGQHVDENELNKFIAKVQSSDGTLDYDAFTLICSKFLKDPAALARASGDEFAFKHLIKLPDFSHP